LVTLTACSGGGESSGDGERGLEQFFTPGPKASGEIGSAGGEVKLDDGIALALPAGTLSKTVKVTLQRSDRTASPAGPDLYIGKAVVVTVDTNADVEVLNPPARLTAPMPEATTIALVLRDGTWAPVATTATAGGLSLDIDHFSTTTVALLEDAEWVAAGKVPSAWEAQHRAAVEASDPATKQFYGVGELSRRTSEDKCKDFKAALSPILAKATAASMALPGDKPNILALANFLKHGDAPSVDAGRPESTRAVNPYYWQATAASMGTIAARLQARGGKATPADLLAIAVEANGGNVPLGVLAAHNFLKDAAYQGRLLGDPKPEGGWTPADSKVTVDPKFASVAASMETWRTKEAWSPKGRYDKLGPLYHMFATMTASVWGGGWFGQVAENGEAFLRFFGIGSDVYDPEKGEADTCGRLVGDWINNPKPLVYFQPLDAPIPLEKASPLTLIVKGLEEQTGITFRVVEGEATLAKSLVQADPERAGPECDKVGQELLCGNSVTVTRPGRVRVEAAYKDGLASITFDAAAPSSLALVEQIVERGACQVDEGNVRAGSPFTQRCNYMVTVNLRYSAEGSGRIFCGIGPSSGQAQVQATTSATVSIQARFAILVQPGVGLGRPLSPSGCFLEVNDVRKASVSLDTNLPGP
jgi:hypothetical protein